MVSFFSFFLLFLSVFNILNIKLTKKIKYKIKIKNKKIKKGLPRFSNPPPEELEKDPNLPLVINKAFNPSYDKMCCYLCKNAHHSNEGAFLCYPDTLKV